MRETGQGSGPVLVAEVLGQLHMWQGRDERIGTVVFYCISCIR